MVRTRSERGGRRGRRAVPLGRLEGKSDGRPRIDLAVLNLDQEQTSGRYGRPGGGTVFGGQDAIDVMRAQIPSANVEERADNVAHHVVEEAAAVHAVEQQIGFSLQLRREDGA